METSDTPQEIRYSYYQGIEGLEDIDPIEQYRLYETEFNPKSFYYGRDLESLAERIRDIESARDLLLREPTEENVQLITKEIGYNLTKIAVASYKFNRKENHGIQEEE